MIDKGTRALLKSVLTATDDEIAAFEREEGFTAHPMREYERYGDWDTLRDYGAYYYFKGAGTPGGVCAGYSSGYQVPKDDLVSLSAPTQCTGSGKRHFHIKYRVA